MTRLPWYWCVLQSRAFRRFDRPIRLRGLNFHFGKAILKEIAKFHWILFIIFIVIMLNCVMIVSVSYIMMYQKHRVVCLSISILNWITNSAQDPKNIWPHYSYNLIDEPVNANLGCLWEENNINWISNKLIYAKMCRFFFDKKWFPMFLKDLRWKIFT